MRSLLLMASLVCSLVACGGNPATGPHGPVRNGADAAPNKQPKPLAILSIPTAVIVPDRTASRLARACSAAPAFKLPGALSFNASDVSKSLRGLMEANDASRPSAKESVGKSLGLIVTACEQIRAQQTIGAEEWNALRAWSKLPAEWTDALVEGASVVGTKAGGLGEAAVGGTLGSGDFQSLILNGLADFLVTRAKSEAALYLKTKLKNQLCVGSSQALPYLPNLCLALDGLDSELSLNAVGAYLQAAAQRDLEQLPEALLGLLPAKSDERASALLGLIFFREARGGKSPIDLLSSLSAMTCTDTDNRFSPNVARVSCLASKLIYAFKAQATKGLDPDMEVARYMYVGVALSLESAANKLFLPEQLNQLIAQERQVFALLKQLEQLSADIRATESKASIDGRKTGSRDRVQFVAQSLTLLIESARVVACLDSPQDCANAAKSLDGTRHAVDFGARLFAQDVGGAATAGAQLLVHLDVNMPNAIKQVFPLIVELANAKSSKDVSAALEAAAAPVGSYQSKYERPGVAINAFLGVSGGVEWVGAKPAWSSSGTVGLFTPIGLELTSPLSRYFHGGVFLSVLDLGALASSRLSNETTSSGGKTTAVKDRADLSFAQVFSPGLFLTLGLCGSPITLGAGSSLTPSLRSLVITDDATKLTLASEDLPALRLHGFIAIDLTLLPF